MPSRNEPVIMIPAVVIKHLIDVIDEAMPNAKVRKGVTQEDWEALTEEQRGEVLAAGTALEVIKDVYMDTEGADIQELARQIKKCAEPSDTPPAIELSSMAIMRHIMKYEAGKKPNDKDSENEKLKLHAALPLIRSCANAQLDAMRNKIRPRMTMRIEHARAAAGGYIATAGAIAWASTNMPVPHGIGYIAVNVLALLFVGLACHDTVVTMKQVKNKKELDKDIAALVPVYKFIETWLSKNPLVEED